jgi:hypothetical protein
MSRRFSKLPSPSSLASKQSSSAGGEVARFNFAGTYLE